MASTTAHNKSPIGGTPGRTPSSVIPRETDETVSRGVCFSNDCKVIRGRIVDSAFASEDKVELAGRPEMGTVHFLKQMHAPTDADYRLRLTVGTAQWAIANKLSELQAKHLFVEETVDEK